MFKPANVVMLPTENKAQVNSICIASIGMYKYDKSHIISNAINNLAEYKNTIVQHLYITSDEEIKEGNCYYNPITNNIHKANLIISELNPLFKKIIATTDTSLNIKSFDKSQRINLPQTSQQFIEKYIEEYNKGNIITKVEVEYKLDCNCDDCDVVCECSLDKILVTNSDNTINIKSIKDNWNREEVENLITRAYNLRTTDKEISSRESLINELL